MTDFDLDFQSPPMETEKISPEAEKKSVTPETGNAPARRGGRNQRTARPKETQELPVKESGAAIVPEAPVEKAAPVKEAASSVADQPAEDAKKPGRRPSRTRRSGGK